MRKTVGTRIKIVLGLTSILLLILFMAVPELFWELLFLKTFEQTIVLEKQLLKNERQGSIAYLPILFGNNQQNRALVIVNLAKENDWNGKYYQHIKECLLAFSEPISSELSTYVRCYELIKFKSNDIPLLIKRFRKNLFSKDILVAKLSFFLLFYVHKDFDYLLSLIINPAISESDKELLNYKLVKPGIDDSIPYFKFIQNLRQQKQQHSSNIELVKSADAVIQKFSKYASQISQHPSSK